MFDFAVSRQHMVDCQIRTNDVTDIRIIRAFKAIAREAFIPKAKQALAYSDVHINMDSRTMMRPRDFSKLLQGLNIQPTDVALDIGCARGYSTAVLSQPEILNAAVVKGDLKAGAREHGPFDIIFVNGAVTDIPQSWLNQLAIGGRLAVIVQDGPIGQAMIYTRSKDAFGKAVICDANVPLMSGFQREEVFSL